MSQSALVTKFAHHVTNATSIMHDLKSLWQEIYSISVNNRKEHQQQLDDMQCRLEFLEAEQKTIIADLEDEIQTAVTDVYQKMFAALSDEIQRLSRVLEEFDRPFEADPTALEVYKKELNFHVEECLSRNLHVRCSGFVHNVLRATTEHMDERVSQLLTSVTQKEHHCDMHHVADFEMLYHFDCCHLLSDFTEDIEFHFSLGITSLVNRFLGPRGSHRLAGYAEVPRSLSLRSNDVDSDGADSVVAVLSTFTSIYSGTTIGSLALVAVVTKSVGWKVIMACAAAYCMLYIYERVTWTTKAKYEAFRRQYIAYATSQLNMVVGMATENCSSQVQRELLSTFNVLQHQINLTNGEMQERFERMYQDSNRLENAVSVAERLKQRNDSIETKLSAFVQQFLKPLR
jgi:mitofusin